MSKYRRTIGTICVISLVLGITACGKKETAESVPIESMTTPVTTEADPAVVVETLESAKNAESKLSEATDISTIPNEEGKKSRMDGENSIDGEEKSEMRNPMKKAESSEDFKAIDLSLVVPEHEGRCSNKVYYIIDGNVAHIKFYDEMAHSEAVARAGKEELGDISGVYYKFDDSQDATWRATTASGDVIMIKIQSVVEGSDIPGVLATWNYNGMNYTLWEDEGKNDPSTVAKTACEIAVLSADAEQ